MGYGVEAQRSPLAGPTLAFLSVHWPFSSEVTTARSKGCWVLPCSLSAFFFFFLPFFLESAEQHPEAAFPWQQEEDLPLVHSVLALSPPLQAGLLWADAVAPNKNSAPRRRMCFRMVSLSAIKILYWTLTKDDPPYFVGETCLLPLHPKREIRWAVGSGSSGRRPSPR